VNLRKDAGWITGYFLLHPLTKCEKKHIFGTKTYQSVVMGSSENSFSMKSVTALHNSSSLKVANNTIIDASRRPCGSIVQPSKLGCTTLTLYGFRHFSFLLLLGFTRFHGRKAIFRGPLMLLNKYRCSSFLASIGLLTIFAFGQSAETGSAFNKYMSPEGGINPMSGTVALEKNLASLSAGQISVNFSLKYSGNVFKEAKTANDLAPSGLVGLGWSFGRSQIVCDCKDNAYLDDDIYYLVTADGNRYKIFEEKAWRKHFGINYNANAQEKWWVEGNPFWKVERIVGQKKLPETSDGVVWSFVLGWKITDAEGITHIYGDIDEKNTMTGPTPNATEYDLIWAQYKESNVYKPAYGLMESTLGGEPSHYPIAWNISREESLDGNYLKYNYTQVSEKLEGFFNWSGSNASTWNSEIGYTKETYLDSVSASNGAHIDFSYEYKGQGDFDGEVKDSKGDDEGFGGGTDMFKERVGRKFLSSINVF